MPELVIQIFIFAAAASIGSFLNVCIYRMPLGISIVSPPSSCPGCGTRLRAWDNVPIFGYIALGGKCRYCKAHISIRYPLVEALTAILALLIYIKYGPTPDAIIYFLFSAALITVSFIDLDHRIIPDSISLPGIIIGFGCSFILAEPGYLNSLIGLLVGGGSLLLVAWIYTLITGKDGMGGGDIKLLAMMGAFLGWQAVIFIIFVSSISGAIIGVLALRLMGKGDARTAIPFGPFLALGALVHILAGAEIISLYLGMLRV